MASTPESGAPAPAAATGLVASTMATLRRHAPFNAMRESHLAFLASRLKLAYFSEGEVILEGGQGIPECANIIKQGAVVVSADTASDEVELALHEGECFPIGALLAGRPVTRTYRAS